MRAAADTAAAPAARCRNCLRGGSFMAYPPRNANKFQIDVWKCSPADGNIAAMENDGRFGTTPGSSTTTLPRPRIEGKVTRSALSRNAPWSIVTGAQPPACLRSKRVARVERQRNPGTMVQIARLFPHFAEPVIGPRFARTRWLNAGYRRERLVSPRLLDELQQLRRRHRQRPRPDADALADCVGDRRHGRHHRHL